MSSSTLLGARALSTTSSPPEQAPPRDSAEPPLRNLARERAVQQARRAQAARRARAEHERTAQLALFSAGLTVLR